MASPDPHSRALSPTPPTAPCHPRPRARSRVHTVQQQAHPTPSPPFSHSSYFSIHIHTQLLLATSSHPSINTSLHLHTQCPTPTSQRRTVRVWPSSSPPLLLTRRPPQLPVSTSVTCIHLWRDGRPQRCDEHQCKCDVEPLCGTSHLPFRTHAHATSRLTPEQLAVTGPRTGRTRSRRTSTRASTGPRRPARSLARRLAYASTAAYPRR